MNDNGQESLHAPRWMHDRVLFEIEDGGAAIPCSVSKAAIQDASEKRSNLPRDLMAEFTRLQERITQVALAKFRARPGGVEGVLHIWSDDLDEDPRPAAPSQAIAPQSGT
jgi:hypothetical protein